MPDFLLEIGTEEIPAAYLGPAVAELADKAGCLLGDNRLGFSSLQTEATPRRLLLYVAGLEEEQAPLSRRSRGPSSKAAFDEQGRPTKAALGFARGQGISPEQLQIEDTGSGQYVFAVVEEPGRRTLELLPGLLPGLISGLSFPRTQRWGNGELRFARPLRWLLALMDEEVVPFAMDGLESGRMGRGHRFLAPAEFSLGRSRDYWPEMEARWVMLRQADRMEAIRGDACRLAAEHGGQAVLEDQLLDEVAWLLEYPTAFSGRFEVEYLHLPRQVLVSVMQKHQKYFPVAAADGKLLPFFIGVRNGRPEGLDTVRRGNEKVLGARLADARFFYDEDRKLRLEDRVPSLGRVTFQDKLGSLLDKTGRLRRLAAIVAETSRFDESLRRLVDRTALLSRADLLTSMVCEFPELQGVMGREYAALDGEPQEVCSGIFEQYLPRFAGDDLPCTPVGMVVALADRLDTLAGFFGIGIRFSGSQDPFALRRQGSGAARILLQAGLPLRPLLLQAVRGYENGSEGKLPECFSRSPEELAAELRSFLDERFLSVLVDEGHSRQVVEAVVSAGYEETDDLLQRVQCLQRRRGEPGFEDILIAYRRVQSILKDYDQTGVKEAILGQEAEVALFRSLNEAGEKAKKALSASPADFGALLEALVQLCPAINAFFDGVMVMAEDEAVRRNRLSLLAGVRELFLLMADFSRLA